MSMRQSVDNVDSSSNCRHKEPPLRVTLEQFILVYMVVRIQQLECGTIELPSDCTSRATSRVPSSNAIDTQMS